ncbi:MAG: insulinase family protein [Candidatus Omnitrophica bacterium]|nr:insulinase family protein [Candidatus Omnitrophota bacterium]
MRRTVTFFFIAVTCLFFQQTPSPAAEEVSSKIILDNGLTVLTREMPASPVVCLYALVKTGSATEGEYLGSGVSHFLEHMMFKGTQKRGVGQIAAQIQAVGGSVNASTGKDYTIYTIEVPPEAFDMALDVLTDMLMNSTISPEEVERERQVVLGEMRMDNDNPDRRLGEIADQNIYIAHAYRYPIIGYKETFLHLTRDDIWSYYRSQYVPNNIILSVAGAVQTREILPKIRQSWSGFPRQREVARNVPPEPPQISGRRYQERYPTDLTRLLMAFSSVSLLDKDLYALDVLAMILGQGESSPLYLQVYKKKSLVHDISAYNYTPVDRGYFGVTALLEDKNVEPATEAVWDEIRLLQQRGVNKEELEKAKRQVLSGYLFSHQKASSLAYAQAVDEAFTGDDQFSLKYVAAVKKVSAQDIQRVANQYLTEPSLTLVLLRPLTDQKEEEISEPVVTEEIQRYVLANGLVVLLREDHTLPIVSIRLSLQGGTRQELLELNGISRMTADLWTKGTKARSAAQIAAEVESLGMAFGTFSGKNSLGLNVECLSEDAPRALALLEEMVKDPAFSEEEILREKEDMKAALRRREDSIFQTTALALRETLFLTHPLRRDELGSAQTIEKITRKDIVDFYRKFAAPANMVLSVFGDISADVLRTLLEKKFGALPGKEIKLNSAHEDPPAVPRVKEMSLDKEQAMVMFGFHGVDLKNPDRYGLDVVAALLGSSFSGRLFNSIREELGQAYTLGGDLVPALDAGWIYFYVQTTDEKVEQVKQMIQREIRKLQDQSVSQDELNDIKTYLKGNFRAGLETNSALSFVSGLDELYGLGYRHYHDYAPAIDRVEAQDVQRLARQYLDLNHAAIVTARPKKSAK